MNAKEIREFYERNIAGEIDGSLDEHNLCNALLGEIAAQIAEVNERTTSIVAKTSSDMRFLGHTADCPLNPLTGSGVPIGPNYCGHCGGYIGK